MKLFQLFIFCSIAANSFSQNVGINNPSPAERLDVNGNINVTGTIKANGTDGAAGQVLMKNGSGVMQWSDLSSFKNFTTYYVDGSFTIPAGVTKIAVELWGAGGGGHTSASGGGGAYIMAMLNVTAGTAATIDVGAGSTGTTSTSVPSGGPSTFTLGAITLSATGGGGAQMLTPTTAYTGSGGFVPVLIAGVTSYVGVKGTAGNPVKRNYVQFGATTFYETIDGGDGGYAYNAPEAAGKGGRMIWNVTASGPVHLVHGSIDGNAPGGGGASGIYYNSGSTPGGNGGAGLVIIRY